MNLEPFFKSVLEQDRAPIVLCDKEHTIIYMNPAAVENYAKYGGKELVGKSTLACHNEHSCDVIREVVAWFAASESHNIVYSFKNKKHNKDVYIVALRDENKNFIGYYEKHEFRDSETMKIYDLN